MIKSVLNKIRSNIWMFVCLIIGSLLITGILSSIPMYTAGTLRQMLAIELKRYEDEYGVPSGQMFFEAKIPNSRFGMSRVDMCGEISDKVLGGLEDSRVTAKDSFVNLVADKFSPLDRNDGFSAGGYTVNFMSGFEEHISITAGRMYSDDAEDDVIEVIISEEEYAAGIAANENKAYKPLELEKVYEFSSSNLNGDTAVFKIKLVGVFKMSDSKDGYWYNPGTFEHKLFLSQAAFEKAFYTKDNAEAISEVEIYCNLDFTGMRIDDLPYFVAYYNDIFAYTREFGTGRSSVNLNCVRLINEYMRKSGDMQLSLWMLNVPVIAMLAFYMVMVTKMIIEEDRNEISTFKSRGARKGQIFMRYLWECVFISVFAVILGPLLGFFAAKFIGSASGFLEFASRDKMIIELGAEAYLYAVIACLIFAAMILIPALSATGKTIVNLKQRNARKSRKSFWEKSFLDIICLVVSIGLFVIYKRTNGFNVDGTVDPIVYIISSLFILGCGLLFLRIYPFVLAILFKITKRILPTSIYSAFIQVSRGGSDSKFLMLFLVMTISVGIYSSGSARIINNNVEDTVLYTYGADAMINPDFTGYSPYRQNEDGTFTSIPESFRSFPLTKYMDASYIEYVSRVEYCDYVAVADLERGSWMMDATLMAIDPYEFANIAWCGESLNGTDWYNYINIMEESPTAVVISRTLAALCHVNVGDNITVDINSSNKYGWEHWPQMQCYVLGIVDYWPTAVAVTGEGTNSVGSLNDSFIVANFEYLYKVRDTSPFGLFVSLSGDALDGEDKFAEMLIADGLIDSEEQLAFYRPDIMEDAKNDSVLKGLNGSFSIGFISTLIVAFVGFVIYWIMNVRKRKLQFGILRAMGLTKGKMTLMLVWEHLLTTGVSVVMGVLIGALTVKIYTPLLKIAYSDSVLPLEILFNRGDNLKIYAVVVLMLIIGIVVLSLFINKLKINEAVKIGEE